jgi:hypothetical protein
MPHYIGAFVPSGTFFLMVTLLEHCGKPMRLKVGYATLSRHGLFSICALPVSPSPSEGYVFIWLFHGIQTLLH